MHTVNDAAKSQEISNDIVRDLNSYNDKIFKDKKESYFKKILFSLMVLDIPGAMFLCYKSYSFPNISHKKISIHITRTLEEKLIEKNLTLEETESLLNNFYQQFIHEINKNNEYDDFLDFYITYLKYKDHTKLREQKDNYFSTLVTYVHNYLKHNRINEKKLDVLKRFLEYPCILTPQIIELRNLARIILKHYNKEKTSTENDEMLSEEELLYSQERNSLFHLIDKIRLLPKIKGELNVYLKRYNKKHPLIRKISNFSNKIDKFSDTANFAYCFSMIVVYITRTYMDFVKDSIQKKLKNEYNVTDIANIFDDRDWAQYYEHKDGNEFLNALPCILPVILIVFFIINSVAKTILSNHKTDSVLKAIDNDSRTYNSEFFFPNVSLYNPLNVCLGFRCAANVILQFIDVITHPIKDLIFDAGVLRLFTVLSLIEESYKLVEFKKKCSNYKLKNEKLVKICMVIFCFLTLSSEYLNYFLVVEKSHRLSGDVVIKAIKPSGLIFYHNLTGGSQNIYLLAQFFLASLYRNISAFVILPGFMVIKSLKHMGLLSTADVLLTVKCDNIVATSIETNNCLKITEEIYKKLSDKSISHDSKPGTSNNSTTIDTLDSSPKSNNLEKS